MSVIRFTVTTDQSLPCISFSTASRSLFSKINIHHLHVSPSLFPNSLPSHTHCCICSPSCSSCFTDTHGTVQAEDEISDTKPRVSALFRFAVWYLWSEGGWVGGGWICNTRSHIGSISQRLWTPLPTQDTVVKTVLWKELQGIYTFA